MNADNTVVFDPRLPAFNPRPGFFRGVRHDLPAERGRKESEKKNCRLNVTLGQVKWATCLLPLALTACAKRYAVEGLVIRVDPAQRTMLVSHRAIAGYMPAMTMPFKVAPEEDLSKVAPGTRLDFQLRVGKRESIARKLKPRTTRLEGLNGEQIRVAPPVNKLGLGDALPGFHADRSDRPRRPILGFPGPGGRDRLHLHALPAAGCMPAPVR